jgi:sensor domain CHASE-containing protein
MENNTTVATEVLRLLKKEYNKTIKRLYILLLISIALFVASIVDSIYQRCRIIDILEQYEVVENMMDRTLDAIESSEE